MKYDVVGKTQVKDYEWLHAGVEYCKEKGIPAVVADFTSGQTKW